MSKFSKFSKFIFSYSYLLPDEKEDVMKEFAQNSFKLGWQASIAVILLHFLAKSKAPDTSTFFSAEIIVVLSTILLDVTSFQFKKLHHSRDKFNWLLLNLSLRFTFYFSLSYILANYIGNFGLVSLLGVISVGIIAAGSESIVHHAFSIPSYAIFLIASYISMPLYALFNDKAEGSIFFFGISLIHFPFQIPKIIARNKMFFEKLRARYEVKKEKEQFEILFDMIPAGVSWLKNDLSYIQANQYLTNYTGQTKQAFNNKKFGFTQNINSDPDIESFLQNDETSFSKNYNFKSKNNIYRRHQTFWKKIKNNSEIVVLSVDIEEQLKSKELNEILLRRINTLMSSSKIGILFLDLENHIVETSEEFSLITNIKSNDRDSIKAKLASQEIFQSICFNRAETKLQNSQLNIILNAIASKINSDQVIDFKSKFMDLVSGKIKILDYECSFSNSDRGWIWVSLFFTVENSDNNHQPLTIIGYFTDITKRKEMETSLAQSTKMASLGQMATGIAYEIDNPLAVISGKVRVLKKQIETRNLNPELALSEIEKLESMVSRIIKIIKGLKAISKEEETNEVELVPIKQIIDETASISYTRFLQADIDLNIATVSEDYKIYCKSVQISQVVLNLLNNSYDAIRDSIGKKWVNIDFVESKTHFYIYVTDSGKGIPIELHDKLLNPFFTTKESGKGTGLGLSISQSIMHEHKGEIGIDKGSKNTRFYLQFPKPKPVKDSDSTAA